MFVDPWIHYVHRSKNVVTVFALAMVACQPAADFPDSAADSAVVAAPPQPPGPPAARATDTTTGDTTGMRSDTTRVPSDSTPMIPPVATDTVPRRVPVRPADEPPPSCDVPSPTADPGTRLVTVYFTCAGEERPVRRRVPQTEAVLRASLEELLRGPTAEERAAGFTSFFSAETVDMLNYVAVGSDGVARIDFDDFSRLIPNASSSAGSAQLLDQLRATIFQFPTVRAATISFDGDCDAFWNWLQRDCQRLTRR